MAGVSMRETHDSATVKNEKGDDVKTLEIGEMRAQAAYCDGARRVIAIVKDPELERVLARLGKRLQFTKSYPDLADGSGNRVSVFKIEVVLADIT